MASGGRAGSGKSTARPGQHPPRRFTSQPRARPPIERPADGCLPRTAALRRFPALPRTALPASPGVGQRRCRSGPDPDTRREGPVLGSCIRGERGFLARAVGLALRPSGGRRGAPSSEGVHRQLVAGGVLRARPGKQPACDGRRAGRLAAGPRHDLPRHHDLPRDVRSPWTRAGRCVRLRSRSGRAGPMGLADPPPQQRISPHPPPSSRDSVLPAAAGWRLFESLEPYRDRGHISRAYFAGPAPVVSAWQQIR